MFLSIFRLSRRPVIKQRQQPNNIGIFVGNQKDGLSAEKKQQVYF